MLWELAREESLIYDRVVNIHLVEKEIKGIQKQAIGAMNYSHHVAGTRRTLQSQVSGSIFVILVITLSTFCTHDVWPYNRRHCCSDSVYKKKAEHGHKKMICMAVHEL